MRGMQPVVATALQFGWGAFESDIVDALQEYGGDLEDLRTRVSELSNRLRRDDTDD